MTKRSLNFWLVFQITDEDQKGSYTNQRHPNENPENDFFLFHRGLIRVIRDPTFPAQCQRRGRGGVRRVLRSRGR